MVCTLNLLCWIVCSKSPKRFWIYHLFLNQPYLLGLVEWILDECSWLLLIIMIEKLDWLKLRSIKMKISTEILCGNNEFQSWKNPRTSVLRPQIYSFSVLTNPLQCPSAPLILQNLVKNNTQPQNCNSLSAFNIILLSK